MFGRVKRYLGIEGVKIELEIPDATKVSQRKLSGKVIFYSKNTQTVTAISVSLIERYTHGRGKDKKIEELTLGNIQTNEAVVVSSDMPLEIEFVLPFSPVRSEIEEFASKNILFSGLANAAKLAFAAKSEFFVVAEAKVQGTALHPFFRKQIQLI
jgi:hypothetical protein